MNSITKISLKPKSVLYCDIVVLLDSLKNRDISVSTNSIYMLLKNFVTHK